MNGAQALRDRMDAMVRLQAGQPGPRDHRVVEIRPLGAFSDFVCTELGTYNDQIREGQISADELRTVSEERLALVNDRIFTRLTGDAPTMFKRVALLDLVWVSRSLDIAYIDPLERVTKRAASQVGRRMMELSTVEGRHPVLSWSDIAIYHPADDPRSFLMPGEARDQEIFMYRVQRAMEEVFAAAVQVEPGAVDAELLTHLVNDLTTVVKSMSYLNRVRTVGQFYKLDPFLGPNGEYRGHGTGAFSVWSFLMGVFLTDNTEYKIRLLDPKNQLAYDRDADHLVDAVRTNQFRTLSEIILTSGLPCAVKEEMRFSHAAAADKFSVFLKAHHGAMKRHSPASFGDPAPSVPSVDNAEAIRRAIKSSRMDPTDAASA